MALTYGFYDSVNQDRLYSARQFNQFLDGIINDGVFRTIGTQFSVTATGESMNVTVGPGKGWFNGTWTYSDADITLAVDPATDNTVIRGDSVILRVDDINRTNSIEIKKGTDTTTWDWDAYTFPEMTNDGGIHEHRIANIKIGRGVTSLSQGNIIMIVGQAETPFTMFSDLPFATNFTWGFYNAGQADTSGWYQLNTGIDNKYLIIWGQKAVNASGGVTYYKQASDYVIPSVATYGYKTAMMIFQKSDSSTSNNNWQNTKWTGYAVGLDQVDIGDFYIKNYQKDFSDLIVSDISTQGSGSSFIVHSHTIKFSKDFFPGFGYRRWLAIGDPLQTT